VSEPSLTSLYDPIRLAVVETAVRLAIANPTWTMISCVRCARRLLASAISATDQVAVEPLTAELTTAAIPAQPL